MTNHYYVFDVYDATIKWIRWLIDSRKQLSWHQLLDDYGFKVLKVPRKLDRHY